MLLCELSSLCCHVLVATVDEIMTFFLRQLSQARGEARLREMQEQLEGRLAEAERGRRSGELEREREMARLLSEHKRRQEEGDKLNAAARAEAAEQQAQVRRARSYAPQEQRLWSSERL